MMKKPRSLLTAQAVLRTLREDDPVPSKSLEDRIIDALRVEWAVESGRLLSSPAAPRQLAQHQVMGLVGGKVLTATTDRGAATAWATKRQDPSAAADLLQKAFPQHFYPVGTVVPAT